MTDYMDCIEKGWYWYLDSCHPTPPSPDDAPNLNEYECGKYGYCWYDNACHSSKPINCENITSSNPAYARSKCEKACCCYYNGTCHSEPANECSEYQDMDSCIKFGCSWVWDADTGSYKCIGTHPPLPPPPGSPVCDELRQLIIANYGPVAGCTSFLDMNNDSVINAGDVALLSNMSEAECQAVIDEYTTCLAEHTCMKLGGTWCSEDKFCDGIDITEYASDSKYHPNRICCVGTCHTAPECTEGAHEVLEYCPDGVTEKMWRDCINGAWVEDSQACPCYPEGATTCGGPEGYDLHECINGEWVLIEHNSIECGYTPEPQYPCPIMCICVGTPLVDALGPLRVFRDKVLRRFGLGRQFISFYYNRMTPFLSPIIVKVRAVHFIIAK